MYKRKNIYICGGSVQGRKWWIDYNIGPLGTVREAGISIESLKGYHRNKVRRNDRGWAKRQFSEEFMIKYDIHHEWNNGEICYFLTKEVHKNVLEM